MAGTTVATAGATLPEDVILEILTRLGEASALFRCAATCRRVRALVAEPSFLRRLCWDPSFVGFFSNEWRRGEGISIVPAPRSALGAGRRLLSSYIPDAPCLSDWMLPLASHHDILLVRLFSRDSCTMQLAVCDPLAGTWDVLPTLRIYEAPYILGYAIVVTDADYCSSPPPGELGSFRVLLVWKRGLQAFSSGQPSWSAPIIFPDDVEQSLKGATIAHTDAAVCRGGAAHWLFAKSRKLHILRVNPQTGCIASVQLLIPRKRNHHHERIRLTTTSDGRLLSLCTYDGNHRVEIWEHQHSTSENGTVVWSRTKLIKLTLQLEGARFICLGARSSRLLMMDRHQSVYVLDLKGGTMKKMEDEFHDPNLIAVPMEIDWPVFFMSRLRAI